MNQKIRRVAVTVKRFPVTVMPERMGVDNYIPVTDMCMIKECIAPEKSQEQSQEKIPGEIYAVSLQTTGIRAISNAKMSAKSSSRLKSLSDPESHDILISIYCHANRYDPLNLIKFIQTGTLNGLKQVKFGEIHKEEVIKFVMTT